MKYLKLISILLLCVSFSFSGVKVNIILKSGELILGDYVGHQSTSITLKNVGGGTKKVKCSYWDINTLIIGIDTIVSPITKNKIDTQIPGLYVAPTTNSIPTTKLLPKESSKDLKLLTLIVGSGFIIWGGYDGFQRIKRISDYNKLDKTCKEIGTNDNCQPELGAVFYVGFGVDASLLALGFTALARLWLGYGE